MQFSVLIPIIRDCLNQHWEDSLDEFNKPKSPLIRLMSIGQKNEYPCTSFIMQQVFKSTEQKYAKLLHEFMWVIKQSHGKEKE